MNVHAFFDARGPDPTGTSGLRRSFRAAGKLRMNMFRTQMRQAVIDHDVLGLGGGGLALQPPETRLRAFNGWAKTAADQALQGPWLSEWIARAWASGEAIGALQTRSEAPGEGSGAWAELAKLELESITAAVVQAITREAAIALTRRRANKVTTWHKMGRAFDKVGPRRIMALANTFCVACHNRGRLAAYRAAGITKVGVIPEMLLPKQKLLLPGGLGDQLMHDAKHIGYQELGPAKPEYTLSEVEEPIDVGVRTAGDAFVCIECDAFADNSPHDIDEVEDTLPIHPNCRCTWFPWDDQRFKRAADAAAEEDEKTKREKLLEKLAKKRARALAELVPGVKFSRPWLRKDAWNPSQARDPDGKWSGTGGSSHGGKDDPDGGDYFRENFHKAGRIGGYSVPTKEEAERYKRAYAEEGKRVARFARKPVGPHDAWNPDQPREPAGTPEGGEFASSGGGGQGGGGKGGGGAAPKKKLFTPSNDKAHHEQRVKDILQGEVKRNDNYRYIVGKLVDEAKGHGADASIISGLRTKIGESFYKQGLVKKEKGDEEFAQKMFAKGKSYGYNPSVGEAMASMKAPAAPAGTFTQQIEAAEAGLKSHLDQGGTTKKFATLYPANAELLVQMHGSLAAAAAMWSVKPKVEPSSGATIPVVTTQWEKMGGQKGSVPGGMYSDPQGGVGAGAWYIKTPKTEDHVNADLLSNQLYKLAGVPVSDEVKTVLEGKPAVASKFLAGTKTYSQGTSGEQGEATLHLRENFAVDAWLGNRDVMGQDNNNVLLSPSGVPFRIDQGGTLMYRAQGETKPFGNAVEEISSMRSHAINPQTASVFSGMSDKEISASIDKVLAIPDDAIVKLVKAHGLAGTGLSDTLIARKQWLADYQENVLQVPQEAPAWAAKLEQQKAAMKSQATAAELEKAKKVGPYYPAPTSEMGKVAVKHFNEKWATKTPEPHELEEKVADYKNAKTAIEAIQKEEAIALEKAAAVQEAANAAAKKEAAAAAKVAKAAAEAKEKAESAKHQAEIEKIAADLGINPANAEQVDTLVQLAGGDKAKIIQQFKKFQEAGVGKHGYPVSPFEAAMLQSYVGSGSTTPNEKLRSGVWDDKVHVFSNAINTALTKMPPYNDTIKRGFTADAATQATYVPGAIIQWHGFSSCGKSSNFGGNMQCTIKPLPGDKTRARDLGQFNPSEAGGEVLIKAHTPVKVISVSGKPGGTMHVNLEEVEAVY